MNYIELIKRFWELDRLYSFSGNETRLYFYLVEQANCLCWQEWFWHKDDLASAYVGIAKDTLRSCRNKLKQCGLIDFIPGGKGQRDKTRYEILAPKTDPKPYPKSNPKSYPNTDPLNKHKTKTKTIPPLSPVPGEADLSGSEIPEQETSILDLPPAAPGSPPGSAPPPQSKTRKTQQPPDLSFIEDEDMRQVFLEWLEYKTASGKSYKTEQSLRMCYRKLDRLSGGNPVVGREMIEESMANNWQSFFEIKKPTNYERSAKNQPPSPDELTRAVAEGVARANTRQEWE